MSDHSQTPPPEEHDTLGVFGETDDIAVDGGDDSLLAEFRQTECLPSHGPAGSGGETLSPDMLGETVGGETLSPATLDELGDSQELVRTEYQEISDEMLAALTGSHASAMAPAPAPEVEDDDTSPPQEGQSQSTRMVADPSVSARVRMAQQLARVRQEQSGGASMPGMGVVKRALPRRRTESAPVPAVSADAVSSLGPRPAPPDTPDPSPTDEADAPTIDTLEPEAELPGFDDLLPDAGWHDPAEKESTEKEPTEKESTNVALEFTSSARVDFDPARDMPELNRATPSGSGPVVGVRTAEPPRRSDVPDTWTSAAPTLSDSSPSTPPAALQAVRRDTPSPAERAVPKTLSSPPIRSPVAEETEDEDGEARSTIRSRVAAAGKKRPLTREETVFRLVIVAVVVTLVAVAVSLVLLVSGGN